ncbi:MAG TPA: hypothetical protein VLR90_09885, partial [Blastocatellia bacterium]|nr:hypothetical protein [Blastocatellia bacterium]
MSEQVELVLFLLREMLILVVIATPLALIPAYIAKKKGRSFTLWFIYGLFAFFYALVAFDFWWYMGATADIAWLFVLGIALAAAPVIHAWRAKPAMLEKAAADRNLMFGNLVESSAQTTGNDRNIYFFDTMGAWTTIAFLIVAITGVLLVNASLSDTGESVTLVATPPPPPAAAPPPPPAAAKVTKVQPDAGFTSVKEAPKEIKTVVEKKIPVPVAQNFSEGVA